MLQYNGNPTVNTVEPVTVTLSHDDSDNHDQIATHTARPTITPYKDVVATNELAHIWASNTAKQLGNNSIGGGEDNASNILAGTSAWPAGSTYSNNDRRLIQYQGDWNFANANNSDALSNVHFVANFGSAQTLILDTIKVFRVYQPDAFDESTRSRVPIGNSYNHFTEYGGSGFTYEDTAFEQFLKDHMTVTDGSGNTSTISWSQYQTALANAKASHTDPPKVTGFKIDQADMAHVTLSDGSVHDFSKNSGNNSDKSVSAPHATFFFQMDTLTDRRMPNNWATIGQGPSISYTPISTTDTNQMSQSISTAFNGGGQGFHTDLAYTASLHLADVNDANDVKSLDNLITNSDWLSAGSNVGDANISFSNAQNIIDQLTSHNYEFVGISKGNKTSGTYDSSDNIYNTNNGTYSGVNYGKYNAYNDTDNKAIFTLNFKHKTQDVSDTDPGAQQTRTITVDYKVIYPTDQDLTFENADGTGNTYTAEQLSDPSFAGIEINGRTYKNGDKIADSAVLDVYFNRTAVKDLVTNQVTYGDKWLWEGRSGNPGPVQGDTGHPGYHVVSGNWAALPSGFDVVKAALPSVNGFTMDNNGIGKGYADWFVHPGFDGDHNNYEKTSLAYEDTPGSIYYAQTKHTVYYIPIQNSNRTYTEHYKYVDSNGNPTGDAALDDKVTHLYEKGGTRNWTTNEVTYGNWNYIDGDSFTHVINGSWREDVVNSNNDKGLIVTVPSIDGYTAVGENKFPFMPYSNKEHTTYYYKIVI